jgi:hypothetical protein
MYYEQRLYKVQSIEITEYTQKKKDLRLFSRMNYYFITVVSVLWTGNPTFTVIIVVKKKSEAVPLHAMEAPGGEEV